MFLFAHTKDTGGFSFPDHTDYPLGSATISSLSLLWVPAMFVFGNHAHILYAHSWLGTKSAQVFTKCVRSEKESQLLKATRSDLEAGADVFKNNSSKNRFSSSREGDVSSNQVEERD